MPEESVSEESKRRIAQVKALFAKALSTQAEERTSSAKIAVKKIKQYNLAFEMPSVADRNRVVELITAALGPDDAQANNASMKLAEVAKHYPLVDMNQVGAPWQSVGRPPPTPAYPNTPPWWSEDPRVGSVRPSGTPKAGQASVDWSFFEQAYRDAVKTVPQPATPAAAERDLKTFFERLMGIDPDSLLRRARARQAASDFDRDSTRAEAEKILEKLGRMPSIARAGTPRRKRKRRLG
jgi:hypothetical protein